MSTAHGEDTQLIVFTKERKVKVYIQEDKLCT